MDEARRHGGNLAAAIARYGGERGDWLDLSTGINPCPPLLPPIEDDAWVRLPGDDERQRCLDAARSFYAAASASIVCAPGSQSLVSLWPHLFAPCEAAVVTPSYGEHRIALEAAGHHVRPFHALAEIPPDAKLVVLVNPNNPDGRLFERADLQALAEQLARSGGLLVVDEAFMDCEPRQSLAPLAGQPGLLVLRSFGKFFGLAGLRLGFALTDASLTRRIEARLGPWAVSGPALAIASALMADAATIGRLRDTIEANDRRLSAILETAGLAVEGRTALFQLVRHDRAGDLFDALCRRRILTRPFAERADWIRFGLPADTAAGTRLAETLGECLPARRW